MTGMVGQHVPESTSNAEEKCSQVDRYYSVERPDTSAGASKNRASSNVPQMPNRRVNKDVKDDITAKAISGNVVSKPASN